MPDVPQSLFRDPSGQWYLTWSAPESLDGDIEFHTKSSLESEQVAKRVRLRDLFDHLYDIAGEWSSESRTLWHPRFWTPTAQALERSTLQDSVEALLIAIQQEKKTLCDVSWQQLEEIVAEVLRVHDLEIHMVRESPQGGRGIIARGELIPGQEPITMAVEVKHKAVVGRPEVETALWQNRQFPALMFVTSGRFTSGVIEEKRRSENQLRLFLKDGDALGDLIRDYSYVKGRRGR